MVSRASSNRWGRGVFATKSLGDGPLLTAKCRVMRYAPLLVAALAVSACGPSARPTPPASPETLPEAPIVEPQAHEGVAEGENVSPVENVEPAPIVESPAAPQAPEAPLQVLNPADASNALGFDLYARIRAKSGNLAFSPASVMAALAMTYGGAAGHTRDEMARVLRLDPGPEGATAVGKAFSEFTKKDGKGVVLRMANRLFGDARHEFEPEFLEATKTAFGAPFATMDFRTAYEPARLSINQWVASQTERKIRDLIPVGGVRPETRLVLVNAVYFLGKWQNAFDKKATRPDSFYLPSGSAKQVPMMHASGQRRYGEAPGVKLLELDYKDDDFAMLFVLPNARDGLGAVEASLSPEVFGRWAGALHGATTDVVLPKFKIDPTESLSLSQPLNELGMQLAFDRAEADFSHMAKIRTPEERLAIADVFHKAFVAVDEEGTEAAAATGVVMAVPTSTRPPQKKVFRADHPFLFFLRHKPTGLVLFMGRVVDPA